MMKTYPPYPHKRRPLRRKQELIAWQEAIDELAMKLCPAEEWEDHLERLNDLEWQIQCGAVSPRNLRIFPIWKKYRSEARQVAALYHAMPWLQRLPLQWARKLGQIFFT